jgi:pyruvate/2-oxoacid:ferredoxin oxidoreductase beta subunit
MKISELIKDLTELQNEFGDIEVVLSITDHTDYTYNFDHPGFDVGNVYDEDGEFDDETDYCVCEVSI